MWSSDYQPLQPVLMAMLLAGLLLVLVGVWQRVLLARSRREVKALHERLVMMDSVAQRAGNPVLVTDDDMRVVWCNETFEKETGYALNEVRGQRPGRWLRSPQADPVTVERVRDALRRHADIDIELLHRYRDGRDRWVQLILTPRRDNLGRFCGYTSVLVDIDAQFRTREAYRQTLRDRDALMRTLDQYVIVAEADDQGRLTRVNQRFVEISGFSEAELIGQGFAMLGSGWHPAGFWRDMWTRIQRGLPWRGEICNRSKSGRVYWVQTLISPFVGPTGRIEKYVSIQSDVTEQVLAQQRVREEQRILHSAMDAVGEAFALFDPEQRLVYFNDEYAAWMPPNEAPRLGMRHEDLLRHIAERGVFPEARGRESEWVRDVIKAPRKNDPDRIRQMADGRWIRFVDRVTADGYRVVFRYDVTELQSALIRADAAAVSKDQFLANMSHEIRTPINAIMGMLQLLADTPMDERQTDMVGKSRMAARSLLDIVNDILDYSKIEAGMMQLHLVPFRMSELHQELAVILDGALGQKTLDVVIEPDPALPAVVIGDPVRLKQVLINLGGNAIKFTEHGRVVLRWELMAHQAGRSRIRFAVEDTGIGIDPALQKTIFESFSQGESSTTRRFGGSGLGLTISQHLVHSMGGHINLVSMPGRGSCFSFEIELPDGHEEDLPRIGVVDLNEVGERALEGIRILLVEDNALNQEVAMSMLAREGAAMTLAENGLQAVEALRAAPTAFDLVLMDMQMPVLDGLRATECIRGELGLTHLPVVAMTANAMTSDRDNCLKAGMNAHIGKPFDLAEVVRTVRRFTRDDGLGLPPPVPGPSMAGETVRASPVLDDDAALRRLGGNRLLLNQLRVQFGQTARALLQQAQTRAARSEWASAADALHQLKGSAGVVGAARLADHCSRAERGLRSEGVGPDAARGRGWLDGLDRALQEVMDALGLERDHRPPPSDLQRLEPVRSSVRDEAKHLQTLVALKGLKRLLEVADMESMDVHERWLDTHEGARDHRFVQLNACMQNMDFQGAFEECSRLLGPLETVDVVVE